MKTPFRTPRFATVWSGVIFSITFALFFTFIGNIEYFIPHLSVQPAKPSPITMRIATSVYLKSDLIKSEYTERWFPVKTGEVLINKDRFRFVENLFKSRQKSLPKRMGGFFAIVFLLGFFLSYTIRSSWPGKRRYLRSEVVCYFLLLIGLIACKSFFLFTFLPYTLLPVASIPAITIFFLGRRIGLVMSIAISLIAGILLDTDIVAMVFFMAQSLAAMGLLRYNRRKKRFLLSTLLIEIAGIITILSLTFILSGQYEPTTVQSWRNSQIIGAIGGGILCWPAMWLLQIVVMPMLGIVSQTKLIELQELQHPLLKKLQVQAPPTWEHSRAIANLAEEAASKIGADALLVRVGAYFHDVGKAAAPEFFVENYSVGEKAGEGPHKNLPPEKSAELIIDHVIEGVKILRNSGIPESVVEFVYMHHGTSRVEYFWRKYLELSKNTPDDKKLPASIFTYPGLKPQSPETAILMLADGVEAASRTLTEFSIDEIENVVSRILMNKIIEGQIEESGLGMENLRTILKSFVDSIHFSHHSRIKYQWQEKPTPKTGIKIESEEDKSKLKEAEIKNNSSGIKKSAKERDSIATPIPEQSTENQKKE